MVHFNRASRSANMELIYSIIIAFSALHWQQTAIHGYSLTNATDSVLGCSHNNTRFANGSFVPTVEPCLNCKCINANLICALRVCPEQAFPPPRGCVIVQKKNDCCPYMTCSKLLTAYKDQEKKVITHDRKWYEQNIRNRIFSQNALQRRIEDSDDDEQQFGNGKMCVHNGTVYRSGSAMTTSSLCTYCYCIQGKQKCIQPKCTLPAKGCETILIDSSCCPIRYDCTENKTIKARYNTKYNRRRNNNRHYLRMTSRMQRSRGCLVDSTFYPEGHKLPANQTNPCEICFCIGGSKRCAPKKCAPIIRNCKPIIPDGQCCPSSYDCKTVADHKTAREFTSRQYTDFFSLLFGDEDKENATNSWDYESETEPINMEGNTTNEKGLLDAIEDGLSNLDVDKLSSENQTNVPNQTASVEPNLPNFNGSDDEDEEEISLLDFFLKGESAFTSTTAKPFVFNVTGKPLLNGMTNSPMQIQPILPENMSNESMKFSMLPMSLYNMVKDDGSLNFEADKVNGTILKISSQVFSESKHAIKNIESELPAKKEVFPTSTIKSEVKTTTFKPKRTTTKTIESSTVTPKAKPQNNSNVRVSNQTTKMNKTETFSVKNAVDKIESTTKKVNEMAIKSKTTISTTTKPKTKNPLPQQNVTQVQSSSTEKIISTTRINTSTKKIDTKQKIVTSTAKTTVRSTKRPTESTTVSLQPLTKSSHATTALPKINAVQINSNPLKMEADMNYDYSEPTLPPSLPNLKIIPFLPTDAVKNIIHKSDGYKPNYNYYESNSNSYPNQNAQVINAEYSPFNLKPTYNGADDRIDYDSYKMPPENVDSLDYINVYAGNGNMVQPTSFQMSVNSKLDYGSSDQQVVPSKIPSTVNKNLTVKPPLPPFEPEHEYNLYNLPPKPQPQPAISYNEYNVNVPIVNEQYIPEHNYNVPHFVTMPAMKEPPKRPISNKDSVFSYATKSNFIPPAKTEGGFVPKRTSTDNYIPLHGGNYYAENIDDKLATNFVKGSNEKPASSVEPEKKFVNTEKLDVNLENHQISITTDDHFKSTDEDNNAFLGVDILGPYKQSEYYELADSIENTSNLSQIDNNISFNKIYGALFAEEIGKTPPSTHTSTSELPDKFISTTEAPTFVAAVKSPSQDLTNNAIPLKLITILNNTKKDSPTKAEIPQRKNNKIIDPTDEPLLEDTIMPSATTEMPSIKTELEKDDNLAFLRDVFLSSLNRPSIGNADLSDELLHKSPLFLSRPINKLSPSFVGTASFPGLNSLDSKHNFQTNPIRSELDLIATELNKNQPSNAFSHTNNFNSENYQVLPADDSNITNNESYVVNPVDVDKLNLNSETKIFTPPHKDPAGLLKLAGCNIYGRMYRVGRIIAELSSSCLECRCTEVGVSCTPLNC